MSANYGLAKDKEQYPCVAMPTDGPVVDNEQALTWLRRNWQFAAVLLCIRILAVPLRLQRLSADQIEQALVKAGSPQASLLELICKLCWPSSKETSFGKDHSGREKLLIERLQILYSGDETQDLLKGHSWIDLSLQTKLKIIHDLCNWKISGHSEDEHFRESTQLLVSLDRLHQCQVGTDISGTEYFYPSPNWEDCRLYGKERNSSDDGNAEEQWKTVSISSAELQDFAKQFEQSQHEGERLLHSKLITEIIPGILERSGKYLERIQIEADAAVELPQRTVNQLMTACENQCVRPDPKDSNAEHMSNSRSNLNQHSNANRKGWMLADNSTTGDSNTAPAEAALHPDEKHDKIKLESRKEVEADFDLDQGRLDPQLIPLGKDGLDVVKGEPDKQIVASAHQEKYLIKSGESSHCSGSTSLTPRKRQYEPGWSPLGSEVPLRARKLETKPATNFEPLVAALKGRQEMQLKRSHKPLTARINESPWQPQASHSTGVNSGSVSARSGSRPKVTAEVRTQSLIEDERPTDGEIEQPAPSRSGPRAHLSRHRPSRKRKEMDDADYEQESESDYSDSDVSESEHRARPSKRSQASKSAAAAAAARRRNQLQTQATSSAIRPATVDEEYNRHAKLLQEHEKQQRTAIAIKFPNGGPHREYFLGKLETQLHTRLSELKRWHARKKMEESQFRHGLVTEHPMARMDIAQKELLRQQAYNQQKAQFSQVLSGLSAEEKARFTQLSKDEQYRYLEMMTREREQRVMAAAQKQAIAQLSPEQMHQLQSLPEDKQRETIARLTKHLLSQQQEQAKQQQMMLQRQQQMYQGGMPDPYYGEMHQSRMGSQSHLSSPSPSAPHQQRSPALRASPNLGGIPAANPNLRAGDSSLGLGMDPPARAYNMQGGAHWPMNPSGSIQGSMRFSGMVPIDHGRVPAGPAMQRPKSASPSDVAPSLMGQMHSGAAHPMQQFRRLNPVQQGMIPTGLQGHTAPEPMSLHRINSSGQSLSGHNSLQNSPTMQRMGSASGMPSAHPNMIPTRAQLQPGIAPFNQNHMSQDFRMDPSASPSQHQRFPGAFSNSFSSGALQPLGGQGQTGMMPLNSLNQHELAAQHHLGHNQAQNMPVGQPTHATMPSWQQMSNKFGKPGPDVAGCRPLEQRGHGPPIQDPSGYRRNFVPQPADVRVGEGREDVTQTTSGLKLMDASEDNPDTDHDFVDFAETFLSSEPLNDRSSDAKPSAKDQHQGSVVSSSNPTLLTRQSQYPPQTFSSPSPPRSPARNSPTAQISALQSPTRDPICNQHLEGNPDTDPDFIDFAKTYILSEEFAEHWGETASTAESRQGAPAMIGPSETADNKQVPGATFQANDSHRPTDLPGPQLLPPHQDMQKLSWGNQGQGSEVDTEPR